MCNATCLTVACFFLVKNNDVICTGRPDLQKVIFVIHYFYFEDLLIKRQSLVEVLYCHGNVREAVGFGFFHEGFFLLCLVVFRFTLSFRSEVTAFLTVLLPNRIFISSTAL